MWRLAVDDETTLRVWRSHTRSPPQCAKQKSCQNGNAPPPPVGGGAPAGGGGGATATASVAAALVAVPKALVMTTE